MRRLLTLALGLCLFASPALAGFTQVSGTGVNGAVFDTAFKSGASGGVATTVAMNAGDLAIIVMQENGTSTRNYNCANADGSGSNTWQAAAGKADTTWAGVEFWYSVLSVGVSSGTTLSCSTTISGGGFLITAAAFRPTGTASFDTNATAATGGGASVTTITSGPTPTLACPSGGANCDVCVGASSWGAGNPSSDATFTTFGGTGSGVPWTDAFKRVSATTAQSYTATNASSNQAAAVLACFKDTVAGGGSSYGGGTTIGVGH
jgi:hypothetical protein